MFSHVMVGFNDIKRSRHFYDAALSADVPGHLGSVARLLEHFRLASTLSLHDPKPQTP